LLVNAMDDDSAPGDDFAVEIVLLESEGEEDGSLVTQVGYGVTDDSGDNDDDGVSAVADAVAEPAAPAPGNRQKKTAKARKPATDGAPKKKPKKAASVPAVDADASDGAVAANADVSSAALPADGTQDTIVHAPRKRTIKSTANWRMMRR
jgi:hypothetical protein